MAISFKVENVPISAERDRAMFNTFANNQSYVIKDIGNELSVTSSSSSFVVELGTGEAVICGGSMISEGSSTQLTLSASSSGYLVIEIDLSQTGANICQFKNVTSLVQGNINNGDMVYDLPLYSYTTNASGVSDLTDIRNLKLSAGTQASDTYDGTSSEAMSGKAVKQAIDSLDGSITGTAGAGKTLTAFKQQDGKVTATFGNISITKSQVSDFPTSLNPTAHASSQTTYGVGTSTNYGHLKVIDNCTTNSSDGQALGAKQGKVLLDKINALDYTNTGGGTNKTPTNITQTDGKIAVTYSNISLPAGQVTGLATVATSGSYNDLSNKPSSMLQWTRVYNGSSTSATTGSITTSSMTGATAILIQYYDATTTNSTGLMSVVTPQFSDVSGKYYTLTGVLSYRRIKFDSATKITFEQGYAGAYFEAKNTACVIQKVWILK